MKDSGAPAEFAHYTTLEGLHGILECKAFWATSIRYLNDEREIEDALDLIEKIVPTGRDMAGLKAFAEEIFAAGEELSQRAGERVFIVSFSLADRLSQWRAYGAANRGYAISVDFDKLEVESVDCMYKRSDKESLIRSFLNDLFAERLADRRGAARAKDELEWKTYLADRLARLAARLKDESFEEEHERRIMVVREGGVRCRPGPYHPVPYVEVPLPLDAITGIMVGPTRYPKLAKDSVMALLRHRFDEEYMGLPVDLPKVTSSSIPYRV